MTTLGALGLGLVWGWLVGSVWSRGARSARSATVLLIAAALPIAPAVSNGVAPFAVAVTILVGGAAQRLYVLALQGIEARRGHTR